MTPKTQNLCFRNILLPVASLLGSTLVVSIWSTNVATEVILRTLIDRLMIITHI